MVSKLLQDLRFAGRQLRRSPGFAITGALTLALAISAACVMFSLVRGVLLQPLPFAEAERLVGIGLDQPGGAPLSKQTGQTAQYLLDNARSFSSFGTLNRRTSEVNLSTGNGQPAVMRSLGIGAGYLPTLGVTPRLGRNFTPAEDTPGAADVVLISEALWRGSFAGDPGVIGRILHVNGDPATVVGVLPASAATADSPDLWRPLRISPKDPGYQGTNYDLYARLRPGVSLAEANAELRGLSAGMLRAFPPLRVWDTVGPPVEETAWPLHAVIAAEARPGLLALSTAVAAVLLIACLNMAALMTARAAGRSAELAVRAALGAGRPALLRLLLGEMLLLSLVGAVGGLAGAYLATPLLLRAAPLQLPAVAATPVNGRTAVFALVAALLATTLAGLLPAVAALRRQGSTRSGGARVVGASATRQWLGRSLLVAQVALATALLAIGFVLLGTFVGLRAATPGLRPQHLDVLQVQLKGQRYTAATHTRRFIEDGITRLGAMPGVESAAAVYGLPLDRNLNSSAGPANSPDLVRYAEWLYVSPGYFQTVGTPLLEGHDVSDGATPDTEPVGLVNEYAAKRWFKSAENALDRQIADGAGVKTRVVGVVAPVQLDSLAGRQQPTVYMPISQMDDRTAAMLNGWFPVSFTLRLRPSPSGRDTGPAGDADLARAASVIVNSLDPDVAVSRFVPMQSFLDRSYAAPRFYSWLACGFAAFSVLLTAVGLFGLMSYQVASRTREIGVRMAVGAQRREIAGLVLGRGLLLTGTGLLLGLLLGVALQTPLLHFIAVAIGVSPKEATTVLAGRNATLSSTTALMLLVATAACLVPAHRASTVDPAEALRSE